MSKNRIAVLRKEAGMNQRELGIKLGVGQTTVSAWETGKNEPDNESMHKMAQLFRCSIGYLAGYEHDHATKGLNQEQIRDLAAEEEREKMVEEWMEAEEERRAGITRKEIEEWEEYHLHREWREKAPDMYLELYQISKMFEYLTEAQRKRVLTVVESMFPYAVKGKHTDEIPR